MKNEDIMKAMGDIKDEYIEEAAGDVAGGAANVAGDAANVAGDAANVAGGAANAAGDAGKTESYSYGAADDGRETVYTSKVAERRNIEGLRKFGKWAGGIAAVLVIGVFVSGIGGAFQMGSSQLADKGYYAEESRETNGFVEKYTSGPEPAGGYYDYDVNYSNDATADYMTAESEMSQAMAGSNGMDESIIAGQNRQFDHEVKLIYRANVSLQTTDFEASAQELKDLVNQYGGYFENSQMYNGGYFSDGSYKHAYYTIRIPQANYAEFMGGIQSTSYVVDMNESVEDIGQEYFDTENRLETLKIKEERLQTLMKQADNMSDIIELENALTDTEYMIQMYTSTLNRYDSLIGYSTITVDIEKVVHYENGINQDESFFSRLGRNFVGGLHNFVNRLDNFVIWISYNFITLVIIAVLVVLAIKFQVFGIIGDAWSGRKGGRQLRRENRMARKAERQAKKQAKKAMKNK